MIETDTVSSDGRTLLSRGATAAAAVVALLGAVYAVLIAGSLLLAVAWVLMVGLVGLLIQYARRSP